MTTKEIARRAGSNEVTLFRRYGTKGKLVVEARRHCLRDAPLARVSAGEDLGADLLAIARAYAETNDAYGAAVVTLLAEVSLHEELRGALTVLRQNLERVARVIAAHQARGRLVAGDPFRMLTSLFAPLMASGLWQRATRARVPMMTPEAAVEAFLFGHSATTRPGLPTNVKPTAT